MLGASALKVFKAFVLDGLTLNLTEWVVLLTGTVVAFLVSMIVIKFLMNFVRRHSFESFGWYRIALGIVLITYYVIKINV